MKSNLKGVVAALAFFGLISTASADIVYINYAGTRRGPHHQRHQRGYFWSWRRRLPCC